MFSHALFVVNILLACFAHGSLLRYVPDMYLECMVDLFHILRRPGCSVTITERMPTVSSRHNQHHLTEESRGSFTF